MSKKSRSRRKQKGSLRRPGKPAVKTEQENVSNPFRDHETRGSDTITLIWVLCVAASAMALIASLGFLVIIRFVSWDWSETFQMLPSLILIVGSMTGILGLLLTLVVHKIRRIPAPSSMVWLAVLLCSLPIMIWAWTSIQLAGS
jgi:hypothetical protein